MRKFKHYEKEISISQDIKKGAGKEDAEKIQQWINYHSPNRVKIDKGFGPKTEQAVKEFQTAHGLPATGVVDQQTFKLFVEPLRKAFSSEGLEYNGNFRDLLCEVAGRHADNKPIEFSVEGNDSGNRGPWVRSYCNGEENVYWCMGFVQTIVDQACGIADKDRSKIMSPSNYIIDCDTVGNFALEKGYLIRNNVMHDRISEIKAGDIFFKYSTEGIKWHHTGIIVGRNAGDSISTIEGNAAGAPHGAIGDTSNGDGAYRKTRDLFDNKELTKTDGTKYRDYYEVYKLNL